MKSLPVEDVKAIVRMLGKVAALQTPMPDRRRALCEGLCELVDADIWIWLHSRVDPATNFPAAFKFQDGGWRGESERANFVKALHNPNVNAVMISKHVEVPHRTTVRQEIFQDNHQFKMSVLDEGSTTCGLREAITSTYMLDPHTFSGVGLQRRVGKPSFSDKELAIVH